MSGINLRFPGGKKKALTLSYDDGVEQDIRLIDIMQRNGLKGTFNINSGLYGMVERIFPDGTVHRRLTEDQVKELYTNSGMEVAVHGLTHLNLKTQSAERCIYEVLKDRENLEKQFHTIIRGMAYPGGGYSDMMVSCLEKVGIAYSRTVVCSGNFKLPEDWLRLEPTCHHNDPRLMELAERFAENDVLENPRLFYLYGHSYEFDMKDNWHVIEEFAQYMGKRDDIWYAANIEIYEYVEAYKRLIYSIDGSKVYNPTAHLIYLEMEGKPYCIKPGETVELRT